MALLVYNLTGSAVTLAAGSPARVIPASAAPPARGAAVNVTAELRGLSGANYTALQAQVTAGSVEYEWTGVAEYATTGLTALTPTGTLSADVAGRARMDSDFFDDATVLAKFAADSVANPGLLRLVANGAFADSDATRALFAAGFLSASASGRGLMASDYFTATELASKFAAGAKLLRHPGTPMRNRLMLLGAPGAAAEGDTVTIGADVYEFRASTPPAGGTAGRIWVYNGADSAASRANLIKAINGTVDEPVVTRGDGTGANAGTNAETVVARAGTLLGVIDLMSADAVGGNIVASSSAIACTEGLTTATDIWDAVAMYGGIAEGVGVVAHARLTITTAMINKGTAQVEFAFTPVAAIVINSMRRQNEAWTIASNQVTLTLAGGGDPNNQNGDVVDVIAFG